MEALTEGENALLGTVVAVGEGLLLQPTMYWKNARAQGMPFTLDPRKLYRGIGAALINEAGQLSIQFGVTGLVKSQMRSVSAATSASASSAEPAWVTLSAAVGGGLVGAVFASPVELVMVQQQRFGGSLLGVPLGVAREHGALGSGLLRGLGPALLRDGVYVGGMLGLTPVVQRALVERRAVESPALASLWASAIGGVVGGLVSHPFDVVKTCMQGDLARGTYGGFASTWRSLLKQGGLARLWHGATWRTINITATVYIANEGCNRLPPYITALTRSETRS